MEVYLKKTLHRNINQTTIEHLGIILQNCMKQKII